MTRKSLSDILHGSGDDFSSRWNNTQAAGDFNPLPPGDYVCRVESGELFTSNRNQTPGYKLLFAVAEGAHAGRKVWHDCWLTDAALPQTRRDLGKLGIVEPAQMEDTLPPGIVVKAKVVLRADDNGEQRNAIRRFDVLRIESPDPDAFAPTDDAGDDDGPAPGTAQAEGGDA